MAQQVNTSLSRYILTKDEERVAYTFTNLNLMAIQNEIAIASEEKLALKYNPQNPMEFVQQEAELQGKIGILKFLLAQHEEAQSRNLQLKLESQSEEE